MHGLKPELEECLGKRQECDSPPIGKQDVDPVSVVLERQPIRERRAGERSLRWGWMNFTRGPACCWSQRNRQGIAITPRGAVGGIISMATARVSWDSSSRYTLTRAASRRNLRIVENEAWQMPFRKETRAASRGPNSPAFLPPSRAAADFGM